MKKWLATAAVLTAFVSGPASAATAGVYGSIYDPSAHTPKLGRLTVGKGTTLTSYTGSSETDPYDSLDGGATKVKGAKVTNQNKTVQMAVFCFDALAIQSPDGIVVTGDLGLVLGSRGDLTFSGATLSMSGESGGQGVASRKTGQGGPGAEGGSRNGPYRSNPPPSVKGCGGMSVQGKDGRAPRGRGAGAQSPTPYGSDPPRLGAGGSYGGMGGNGYWPAGNPYGDSLLADLYGGSGGGGGSCHGIAIPLGGGGGGTVELVAVGRLSISGTILASGGNGNYGKGSYNSASGGGSGGGILLAGKTIDCTGATLSVNGGSGGIDPQGAPGGKGGGGRIAIYFGGVWKTDRAGWTTADCDANDDGAFDAPAPKGVPNLGTPKAITAAKGNKGNDNSAEHGTIHAVFKR
jgi:hypothetical protein